MPYSLYPNDYLEEEELCFTSIRMKDCNEN